MSATGGGGAHHLGTDASVGFGFDALCGGPAHVAVPPLHGTEATVGFGFDVRATAGQTSRPAAMGVLGGLQQESGEQCTPALMPAQVSGS